MKSRSIRILLLLFFTVFESAFADNDRVSVRVAAYNVEFSKSASPEQIGEMLKLYNLDIIGFNEAPDGDWTRRVGKVLGMKHYFVGKISSANHKDKYKTILSRTPLKNGEEITLKGTGWNPASTVKATTEIEGVEIVFYSLHVCGSKDDTKGHSGNLASRVLPEETAKRIIVAGDFNNRVGDSAIDRLERAGLRPTWKELEIDLSKEFTWNAIKQESKRGVIDHIMYNISSGAKCTDGGIIELQKPLSDHKPVWAEIVFPRKLPKPNNLPAKQDGAAQPATAPESKSEGKKKLKSEVRSK